MGTGLKQLNSAQRADVIDQLWNSQNGKCFISGKTIDLKVHKDHLDVDHIIPTRDKGKDDISNWALTLLKYNRSKQASNLRVARILANFEAIQDKYDQDRGINLGHILSEHGGAKYSFPITLTDDKATFSFPQVGSVDLSTQAIWTDKLSGIEYFFTLVPKEYIFHDEKLNPRGIGRNFRKLVEEFFKGYPQLHVPLGWIDTQAEKDVKIRLFDGQHKAAAQILLGTELIPIRIFVNPNTDVLLTANTRAGTVLRQVAFDMATQRHLGSSILQDRIDKFRQDRGHQDEYQGFSEEQLVDHFKGEQRQMKKYIIDGQRNAITYHPDNRLREFVEVGGKGTEKPLSYSALEKAVYSQLICGEVLDTPANYKLDVGENPRQIELSQIVRLLNILSDQIFKDRFDFEIGTGKIENKILKGEEIAPDHLTACRMAREEVLRAWIEKLVDLCQLVVISNGLSWDSKRPFHYALPEPAWTSIENFVENLRNLPIWKNRELAATAFGGKRNIQYWRDVFLTGEANEMKIMAGGGLNLMELQQK